MLRGVIMQFQLQVKKASLLPFSSAVISALCSIAGAILVARIAWSEPSGHLWSIAGISLLLALLAFQLWRIHGLYESVDPKTIDSDPLLRRAMNETVRSFTWGNAVFLLLALAVFQFHLSR